MSTHIGLITKTTVLMAINNGHTHPNVFRCACVCAMHMCVHVCSVYMCLGFFIACKIVLVFCVFTQSSGIQWISDK